MTDWTREYCFRRPPEVEDVDKDSVIVRTDIVEEEVETPEGKEKRWSCLSRIMTRSEHLMLEDIKNIDVSRAIDEYTLQLIEEGII